jgi:putative SOS response-associated peptidase YedK
MCGRFALPNPEELEGHFSVKKNPDLAPRYNIAPSQDIAVIRLIPQTSSREIAILRWGLIPFWAKEKKIGYKMINARAESVTDKPAFRAAFKYRRCLIPATGFFEWSHKNKTKQPYFIRLKDTNILAFAGLWEHWVGKDGEVIDSCTVITTNANEAVKNIHDRMPVIIEPEQYDRWLDPGADEKNLSTLFAPFPDKKILAYPVGIEVNNPKNDSPNCLVEI